LRPIERASLATPASGSGAPGGAPPASLLDLGSGLNWTAGATQCYAYPVTTVGSSLTLNEVGIEVKSFDCAPVSGVVAILFTDTHGQPVASENLRSDAWGSASASAPIVGEYLVLIARAPLLNDALVVQVPGSISSSAIAGSSAWEGCGF
ncbi:MAG: hypothetical protein L3J91_02115, partial [Thermoplasmata archaeon]|nr:hypothetical protein [Thermoplasmata archaeon]